MNVHIYVFIYQVTLLNFCLGFSILFTQLLVEQKRQQAVSYIIKKYMMLCTFSYINLSLQIHNYLKS